MPYTIDLFSGLSCHKSWDDLKKWLTSSEGGNLRVVDPLDKSPYALVRYVKGQSDFTKSHVPWCRSLVIKKETCKPVCIAPPKANKFIETDLENVETAEEFIDGTMINIFRENQDSPLIISTRSRIGGNSSFYDNGISFSQMLNDITANLNDILPLEYSFVSIVLQHPKNRIVKQVETPKIYLVHYGTVNSEGIISIDEDCNKNTKFEPIPKYNLNAIRGAKSLEAWITKQSQEYGFGWQGVVLKDGKGKRWRVRSQVYETVRRIRGNESSSAERFVRIRNAHIMDQYLAFYPEDRELFYNLEGNLRKNTRQLLQYYKDTFCNRKIQYQQLVWPYKHHVSVLHNMYKDKLKPNKQVIDLTIVIHYVNTLNFEDLINMTKVHKTLPLEEKPQTEGV